MEMKQGQVYKHGLWRTLLLESSVEVAKGVLYISQNKILNNWKLTSWDMMIDISNFMKCKWKQEKSKNLENLLENFWAQMKDFGLNYWA